MSVSTTRLSNGREVYVPMSIIGVKENGRIDWHSDDVSLTADERRDLGEAMIARWTRYRDTGVKE